jgi:mRNA-degrading endonuclease RelE of RelBE toxin-antitoxin system
VAQKKFSIVFSPAAQKDIAALETDEAIQLTRDIASYLEINPFPFGKTRIKKLTGYKPSLYRLRSGDFRAYYRLLPGTVVILAVTKRKDSAKLLKRLKTDSYNP